MSNPNCLVTLMFYADAARFTYFCTGRSQGWQVMPDGSIHPPSRTRTIRFDAQGYPDAVVFVGCQIAPSPASFPSETQEPWHLHSSLGVVAEPAFTTHLETPSLDLTFPDAPTVIFYRLAVRRADDSGAIVHWDDPKIYRDPDE